MKLRDQVEYFASLHDMDDQAARTAAAHWIGRLGLSGRRDRFPCEPIHEPVHGGSHHLLQNCMADNGGS